MSTNKFGCYDKNTNCTYFEQEEIEQEEMDKLFDTSLLNMTELNEQMRIEQEKAKQFREENGEFMYYDVYKNPIINKNFNNLCQSKYPNSYAKVGPCCNRSLIGQKNDAFVTNITTNQRGEFVKMNENSNELDLINPVTYQLCHFCGKNSNKEDCTIKNCVESGYTKQIADKYDLCRATNIPECITSNNCQNINSINTTSDVTKTGGNTTMTGRNTGVNTGNIGNTGSNTGNTSSNTGNTAYTYGNTAYTYGDTDDNENKSGNYTWLFLGIVGLLIIIIISLIIFLR